MNPQPRPRLGRLPDPDERDRNYPLTAILPSGVEIPDVVRRRDNGAWLDQGNTGTCVGHGWAHFVEDGPVMPPGTVDPYWIYREACKLDPWPGNDDGDPNWGTSVRAGVQALKLHGIVGTYRHAFNLDDALKTIAWFGPLVIGINWYESMFYPRPAPDATGENRVQVVVDDFDAYAGGHCLVANGYDYPRRLIRLKNSWGRGWGVDGRANISFDLFERLVFEELGECMRAKQLPPQLTLEGVPSWFVQEY